MTTTEAPCDNCRQCASIGRTAKPMRFLKSIGGRACLEAATAFLDNQIVCSECGAGVYNGHHFRDHRFETVCSCFESVTHREFVKARR